MSGPTLEPVEATPPSSIGRFDTPVPNESSSTSSTGGRSTRENSIASGHQGTISSHSSQRTMVTVSNRSSLTGHPVSPYAQSSTQSQLGGSRTTPVGQLPAFAPLSGHIGSGSTTQPGSIEDPPLGFGAFMQPSVDPGGSTASIFSELMQQHRFASYRAVHSANSSATGAIFSPGASSHNRSTGGAQLAPLTKCHFDADTIGNEFVNDAIRETAVDLDQHSAFLHSIADTPEPPSSERRAASSPTQQPSGRRSPSQVDDLEPTRSTPQPSLSLSVTERPEPRSAEPGSEVMVSNRGVVTPATLFLELRYRGVSPSRRSPTKPAPKRTGGPAPMSALAPPPPSPGQAQVPSRRQSSNSTSPEGRKPPLSPKRDVALLSDEKQPPAAMSPSPPREERGSQRPHLAAE